MWVENGTTGTAQVDLSKNDQWLVELRSDNVKSDVTPNETNSKTLGTNEPLLVVFEP